MKRSLVFVAALVVLQLACGETVRTPTFAPTVTRPSGQTTNAATVVAATRTAAARTQNAVLTEAAYFGPATQPPNQNAAETATTYAATQMALLTEVGYFAPGSPTAPIPGCTGLLVSRLVIGNRAQVTFIDGATNLIRAKPGFSQEVVDKVPEGAPLTILEGPQCADESTWWYIRTDDGLEGWMEEYEKDIYLLEPIQ